jgi:hypothetical protein
LPKQEKGETYERASKRIGRVDFNLQELRKPHRLGGRNCEGGRALLSKSGVGVLTTNAKGENRKLMQKERERDDGAAEGRGRNGDGFILGVGTLARSLMHNSNSDSAKAAIANYTNRQPLMQNR